MAHKFNTIGTVTVTDNPGVHTEYTQDKDYDLMFDGNNLFIEDDNGTILQLQEVIRKGLPLFVIADLPY